MTEKYQNVVLNIDKLQRIQVIVQIPEQFAEEIASVKDDRGAKKMKAMLASLFELESKQPVKTNAAQYHVVDMDFHPNPKLPSTFILSRERIEKNLQRIEEQQKESTSKTA